MVSFGLRAGANTERYRLVERRSLWASANPDPNIAETAALERDSQVLSRSCGSNSSQTSEVLVESLSETTGEVLSGNTHAVHVCFRHASRSLAKAAASLGDSITRIRHKATFLARVTPCHQLVRGLPFALTPGHALSSAKRGSRKAKTGMAEGNPRMVILGQGPCVRNTSLGANH